jgi:hypothetical protein
MRKKLHPVVLTIAICQVVFGLLVLACDGFGVINVVGFQTMSNSPIPTPPEPAPKGGGGGQPKSFDAGFNQGFMVGQTAQLTVIQKAPAYIAVQYVQAFFGLLLGVLMLVSGTGLFFMQSWARWTAVGYGILSLLARCVFIVYHTAFVLPVLNDLGDGFVKSGHPEWVTALIGLKFLPFLGLLLGFYPLLVIVLMLLPAVGKAFRGKRRAARELDDDTDYSDHFPAGREDDRFR